MSKFIEMTSRVMAAIEDATDYKMENTSRVDDSGDCIIGFMCDDMLVGPINMGALNDTDVSDKEEVLTKTLASEAIKYKMGASITMVVDGVEFFITEEHQEKIIEHASNGGKVDAEYMAVMLAA